MKLLKQEEWKRFIIPLVWPDAPISSRANMNDFTLPLRKEDTIKPLDKLRCF